ncbi:MAG: FRG domain-containing protein [Clostridia bacterium]|nr:FRG domain-containing protein [Clostridia bacterium]
MNISDKAERKTKSTKPPKRNKPVNIKAISSPFIKSVGVHEFANGNIVPIVEVSDYKALNQVIGYAKFINTHYGDVFYRGETKLHNTLLPSISRKSNCTFLEKELNGAIKTLLNDEKFSNTAKLTGFKGKNNPKLIAEAMLQHYGYSTHFVDLVDNHWIALWFGLNQFESIKNVKEYCLYKTRTISPIDLVSSAHDDESLFQYMLMVAVDNNAAPVERGLYIGNDTITIDLRSTLPSLFLRPHAQHGLVLRKNIHLSGESYDLASNVVGIVKLRIDNVIKWLGNGELLSSENLFPSPAYDYGYDILLSRKDLMEFKYQKIAKYI